MAAEDAGGVALDQIAALLRDDADGGWGPYLPDAIAEIVRATGRDTGNDAGGTAI